MGHSHNYDTLALVLNVYILFQILVNKEDTYFKTNYLFEIIYYHLYIFLILGNLYRRVILAR